MEESLKNEVPLESNSNAELIYNHINSSIDILRKGIDSLNTKLSALIGFDALLIRFSSGLPNQCSVSEWLIFSNYINGHLSNGHFCLLLRIFICTFLLLSITLGLCGFSPKSGGTLVKPDELIEKCLHVSKEAYYQALLVELQETYNDFLLIRKSKSNLLRLAVVFLGFATLLSGLDILLSFS
ncbi:hypothetical protein H6F90_22860 [Trichocoleus sp. FACHB-591]|uniref:hypothetical protein n=1 Tax=Trichocoleus sp. FACHB-591 TaxID=2692872 RepID=UPI0016865BCE|nr:hypothetical protein [Trichocoleus sp. FACHB-591]MBD2097916.1 hypothetical protein [Trichocoleus sp. FACHB-591]